MTQYFPKPYEPFSRDINVNVDLSNYATKTDLKNITHIDTSSFTSKINLANLKTEVDKLDSGKLKSLPNNLSNLKTKVDKLDIDKLVPIPTDLSKLSNVIKNDVVKKTEYNAKIKNIEDKIPDISNLATKSNLNTKINEMPSIVGLATTSALAAVENKIPSIINLVKKTDYNMKITEIEKKLNDHKRDEYITTPEFNKLAADVFNARLVQSNLVTKTDFDAKLSSLNRKISQNKSKHLLFQNELNKLKTFDSIYFIGKSQFEEDGTQNHLVFQPMRKYFTLITNTDYISSWKSKGLSDESIKLPTTSNNSLAPTLNYYDNKIRVKFARSCLKQPNKISYTHGKIVNIYIVYELGASSSNYNDPTIKNFIWCSYFN